MDDKIQINFRIDKNKLKALKKLARKKSYENNKDIIYIDLIREAIDTILNK